MRPLIIALILVISFPVLALDFRHGDTMNVTGEFRDNLYVAGGEIDAELESTDDVFMAGGDLKFLGRTKKNLFLAAGELEVSTVEALSGVFIAGELELFNGNFQELVLVAGDVTLDSTVLLDDLTLVGGDVHVGPTTKIIGSASIVAGKVEFSGVVEGESTLFAEKVTLDGTFNDDLTVYADKIRISREAVLQGDLSYYETSDVKIEDGARVLGKTIKIPGGNPFHEERPFWDFTFARFLILLGLFFVTPFIVVLFPTLMERGRFRIHARTWDALGKGFVTLLVFPALWVILAISGLGTPLALILVPFIACVFIIGASFVSFFVGDQIRRWIKKGQIPDSPKARFAWTLVGATACFVIIWIPFLGALIWCLAFAAAIGTFMDQAKDYLKRSSV